MDFVTKAFGSLNIGLPFKLEDEVVNKSELPYKLYDGVLKKDSSECSVFVYEESSEAFAENATSALRKLKLPGVVKHIETVSRSGQTFVVTERVVKWDESNLSYEARKFVVQYILNTLKTLESVAKCSYNGLTLDTVMQAKQTGLPVLVGFDFSAFSPTKSPPPNSAKYSSTLCIPPGESLNSPTLNTYQLGCVTESFLPDEHKFITFLKSRSRPTIERLAGSEKVMQVLNNSLEEVLLDNITRVLLLPSHELSRLCEKLVRLAPVLYEGVIRATILPLLLKSSDPCTFLAILTLISQLHTEVNDEDPIAKFIVHHFTLMDRVVRIKLLQFMPKYLPLLSNRLVQRSIMPKMAFGFTDTEAVVRKASVESTIYLVDKITSAQLNSDLLRLLSRTHADSDPEIRALSTDILCKIAPKLDNIRVIAAALSKALKDPVAKCRSTALLGVTGLQLPADVIADKLLASAAMGMLDKDANIAADSWRVTDYLIDQIRKASIASGPSTAKKMEADLHAETTTQPESKAENSTGLPMPNRSFGAVPSSSSKTPLENKLPQSVETSSKPTDETKQDETEGDSAWGWEEEESGHLSEVDEDAWGW